MFICPWAFGLGPGTNFTAKWTFLHGNTIHKHDNMVKRPRGQIFSINPPDQPTWLDLMWSDKPESSTVSMNLTQHSLAHSFLMEEDDGCGNHSSVSLQLTVLFS